MDGISFGYITAPVNVSPFLASLTKPLIVADFVGSLSERLDCKNTEEKMSINRQILVLIQYI
jgi:hypothetical protein